MKRTDEAGASAWGFAAEGGEQEAREVPSRTVDRQPLQPRNGTPPNPDLQFRAGAREATRVGSLTRNSATRSTRYPQRRSSTTPPASGRPRGGDDRAETTRLCDELLRWSSALEGAERELGRKGGSAGVGGGPGGSDARTRRATSVPVDDASEEVSGRNVGQFVFSSCVGGPHAVSSSGWFRAPRVVVVRTFVCLPYIACGGQTVMRST